MATNLGTVMPIPKGEWVIGTTYKKLNIVSHKGSSYIAIQENAVEPSDDGINWMLVARGASIAQVGLPGVVMPDGDTIVIEENGTISTGVNMGVVNDIITERASDDIATKDEVQAVTDNLYKGNLLKNSNFKLNTNGLDEYSGNGAETVNKWINSGDGIVTVNADGSIAHRCSKAYQQIIQYLDNPSALCGKTVTYSVDCELISGGYYFQIYDINTGLLLGYRDIVDIGRKIITATVTIPEDFGHEVYFGITAKEAGSIKIYHAKLELGSIATEYVEPDLEIEKVRCGQAIMNYGSNQMTPYPIMNGIRVVHESSLDEVNNIVYYSLSFYRPDGTIKRFQVSSSENGIGVYDYDGIGTWLYRGVIAPNCLPLTGGQISGTIRTRHIDGLYMPYPDDETLQELHLNYAYPKSHVYIYSGGTHGEALHRGNSKPVSISSTAPVDTEYLWIDTINMKTKIYKDGAWTIVT